MAGRGVDIKLGEGVRELGGLYVLGTERHEARRIDNQLRGRSGRQGDPGESRFYLSAQDELVRLFAGDRIYNIIERFKLPDDQPMEASILSKQIENAQKKVEEQNFVSRKNVLKYDDVMSVQRMVIYEQRRHVLEGADLSEEIGGLDGRAGRARSSTSTRSPSTRRTGTSTASSRRCRRSTRPRSPPDEFNEASLTREELIEEFQDDASDAYAAKVEEYGAELMREVERYLVLQVVDVRWREHLESMEYLRDGIHLRAMAQKDPLSEYRSEGHTMFEELTAIIQEEIVRYLLRIQIEQPPEQGELRAARLRGQRRGQRRPGLRARVGCRLGRHPRGRRRDAAAATGGGAGSTAGAGGAAATTVSTGQRVVERVRQRRAQRPVPVRLGQEVQEVPRRVAAVAASPTFTLPARCVTHACAFRR